jgi:hypothetical protein
MHDLTCKCGRLHARVESLPYRCRCGEWFRDFEALPIVVTAGSVISSIPARPKPIGNVGTELAAIIPKIFRSEKCDCMHYAFTMDDWGLDGCITRYDEIVAYLIEKSNRRWFTRMFPETLRTTKAKEWLDLAIERTKQKIAMESMSAVWVYWAAGAEGDELRYSMRSVLANVAGLKNVVLCGDRPDWYGGDFIHSPRFSEHAAKKQFGTARWCKWIDSIVKLKKIIASDLVTDRFLWLYDDTFIVQPTTANWLSVPRAGGNISTRLATGKRRNTWRGCVHRTAVSLQSAGMPLRNYSTHYPVVYEKAKLLETIKLFEADQRPRCIETIYLNHHHRNPESVAGVFQYNKRIPENWRISDRAIVVNVGGFKPPVARVMEARFPEPCSVEIP